ncbi:hypothetical protein FJQ54_15910 [Sandaracinobacter neustonicus]|uniref:Uncharacterized protein n=1 Tax=Sandaracinobacter neustonicus TaxID=1715348 RepID=A0A501XD56_9SPHN|nr:hypothetical protein FJQ54_15910 [Sandaracinobacter neustonicus]
MRRPLQSHVERRAPVPYVQTSADDEAVNVAAEIAKLQMLIAKRDEAEAVMFDHLKRLGYVG